MGARFLPLMIGTIALGACFAPVGAASTCEFVAGNYDYLVLYDCSYAGHTVLKIHVLPSTLAGGCPLTFDVAHELFTAPNVVGGDEWIQCSGGVYDFHVREDVSVNQPEGWATTCLAFSVHVVAQNPWQTVCVTFGKMTPSNPDYSCIYLDAYGTLLNYSDWLGCLVWTD